MTNLDLNECHPSLIELAVMLGVYEHHIALISKEYVTKRNALESMWKAHIDATQNWVVDASIFDAELKEGPPSIQETCEMFVNMLS